MKKSKLVLALVSSLVLPLGVLAAEDRPGYQSGSQSGMMNPSDTGQSKMEKRGTATGAEGSVGVPMFDALDTNKDTYISKSELKKLTAERHFRNLDTDRDGKLSREEWQAGGQGTGQ